MFIAKFEYWGVKGRDTKEFLQNLIQYEKDERPTEASCSEISPSVIQGVPKKRSSSLELQFPNEYRSKTSTFMFV